MDSKAEVFPQRLAPGLWVVGDYYFDLYLVVGQTSSALIEAGVSGMIDDVVSQIDSLHVRPTFLVVTHPHTDHVTGLPGLLERYPQALTVAGPGAAEFLAHPKAGASLRHEDRHMTQFLKDHGIEPKRPPLEDPPSLQNCLVARDGDEMDLGGMTLRYLEVKGHSPGKIIVFVPEIGALLLSDSLGFRYPGRGVFPLFLTNYEQYLGELDRLEALDPEIVGPAHQGPIVGKRAVKVAFAEARAEAEALNRLILDSEKDPDTLVLEIFDKYYKDECRIYTPENIMNCVKLVVKRAREAAAAR